MTLFIQTPKRLLEISDAYVMALAFLISFSVTKVLKAFFEKQKKYNSKHIMMPNPVGGEVNVQITDDSELGKTILSCIADNNRYLIKDPELINIVFSLVKAKIKDESIILTPNMMRFLALKLIKNDQTFMVKVGNIMLSANSRAQFITWVVFSTAVGVVGAAANLLPYTVLIMILWFNSTENCGRKCSNYFEQIPKEGPFEIYKEQPNGHICIASTEDAEQLQLYIPTESKVEESVTGNEEVRKIRTYKKSRKKPKQVNFSDFRKTDPVLSSFKELDEPDIPQNICPITDSKDIIDIRVN